MASPTTVKRQMQREESQQHAGVVLYNRLAAHFLNECLPQGALLPAVAQATTSTLAKLTNPVNYRADGKLFQKAATDNLWSPTGSIITTGPIYQAFCRWLCLLDSAGTASTFQSNVNFVSVAAITWNLHVGSGGTLPWDGKAIIGYFTLTQNVSTSFTPGGTGLASSGTTTFTDGSPPELLPQIADLYGVVASSALY